jgi:hypothetical protein
LEKRFPGVGDLIVFAPPPDFYLDEKLILAKGLSRRAVEETAIAALMQTGLVANVYTHDRLRGPASDTDPYLTLFQNGFYEPRTPHLSVLLRPNVYVNDMPGGTGHGTAYDYDRHVPMVIMGPGVRPGMYDRPSGPEDIAPTIARILGLQLSPEMDARVLSEALPESIVEEMLPPTK